MARKQTGAAPVEEGSVSIKFNLVGLVVFSISLVLAGGVLTYVLGTVDGRAKNNKAQAVATSAADPEQSERAAGQETPPWGELLVREIQVERPEEYIAFEVGTNKAPAWVFEQMKPEQARALMVACGLSASQADRALAPERVSVTASNTAVKPDEALLLSLSPAVRAKFYSELGRSAANHYMLYPFCFPRERVNEIFEGSGVDAAIVQKIKKLLYPRGSAECFSDYEFILRSLPAEKDRLELVKALSRQPALLVRVRIRPNTDLDRLLGYWDHGLQVKDARPLLESVKRLENGGTVSLMYLLPRFARERLYTFPMPPKANDPAMDCHWSTMNFFNDQPDDRFANPSYTVQYLTQNYYRVAKPSLYGDVVLILDKQGNAIHSAVYLADDIVFTKNGNNYAQPWMLMRLQDLKGDYTSGEPPQLLIYRSKDH